MRAMNALGRVGLSEEARQTIRRYLPPEDAQRMIDAWEPAPEPPPANVSREALFAPPQARGLDQARENLSALGAHAKALSAAVLGQRPLFTDDLPFESLLDRSFRNARPGSDMLPAVEVARTRPEPRNTGEVLDLAEAMFAAVESNPRDPMQKGFAGIRLALAVVKSMGNVRVVGLDGLSTPLTNLRDDATSPLLARIMEDEVRKSFQELRTFVDAQGHQTVLPATITEGVDTVTIGGVTLEVRKG